MNKIAIVATTIATTGLLASSAPDGKTMTQALIWMHDDGTAIFHDENGVIFFSWDELNEKPTKRGILQVNPNEGMSLVFYDENGENPLIFNRNTFLNLAAIVLESKAKVDIMDKNENTNNNKPLNDA